MCDSDADPHSRKSSSRQFPPRRPFAASLTFVSIMVVAGMGGVIAFLVFGVQLKKILQPEVFGQTYQFLLLVVVGGAVSYLFKESSEKRNRDQERRALLRKMHSDLLDAFNAAKLVRRILRSRIGYSPNQDEMNKHVIKVADYREQMDILMQSQLKFEVYAKQASQPGLFFAQGSNLKTECGKIEEYLRDVIREYEINLTNFSEALPTRQLGDLPKLAEFIGPLEKGQPFDLKFKRPFKAALSALSSAELI